PREIAGAVSARRIPVRARHGRSGGAARRVARDLGASAVAIARTPARGSGGGDLAAASRCAAPARMTGAMASDRVLARLMQLHPKRIDLSLGRIERLLAALGNPHKKLPPAVHVAGTKGKGSTVATMRACLETAGYRV